MLEKGDRLKDEDEVYCLVLKDYGVQVDYRGEDELNCLVSKVDYQGEDEVQTPEPSWVAMLIEVFALRGIIFPLFYRLGYKLQVSRAVDNGCSPGRL